MAEPTMSAAFKDFHDAVSKTLEYSRQKQEPVRVAMERITSALAGIAEHAEPPPGVYRDAAGVVWRRTASGSTQEWKNLDARTWHSWASAESYISQPLVPLWTADELIPDPDDETALRLLAEEMVAVRPALRSVPKDYLETALRVLRARGESRVPTGGADQNGEGE